MAKQVLGTIMLLMLLIGGAVGSRAADGPLSQDDVVLLLIGGADTQKMVRLIEERGVDFQMTTQLAEKFRNAGADALVIKALEQASAKAQSAPAGSTARTSEPPDEAEGGGESSVAGSGGSWEDLIAASYARDPEEFPAAPTFALIDLSGRTLDLADYKGKVVLINFWATWCAPCRYEIPRLVELQNKYSGKGLQIVGIVLDDKEKTVRRFSDAYTLNYPVAMGTTPVRNLYGGVSDLPTSLLISRTGRIYYRVEGVPANLDRFEVMIKALLAERPDRVLAGRQGSAKSAASTTTRSAGLPDPSPERIQEIIREFAAKEKIFKKARDNYAYHQINKVSQLDSDGNVVGTFQQEWDILYDDNGDRIERVTYAPPDTLKGLIVTKEDLENMRNIQPFVMTTDELDEYDVKYLGHVKVDEITAYVFSVRPKEIKKGQLYFQGTIWVDDRDLQIVKSEGRTVPETKTKKDQMNLFPRFTTYREQIDGKFWFPTYTFADDTLYFAMGPIRIKQIIRFTDYKQFTSATKIRVLAEVSDPGASKSDKNSSPKDK